MDREKKKEERYGKVFMSIEVSLLREIDNQIDR